MNLGLLHAKSNSICSNFFSGLLIESRIIAHLLDSETSVRLSRGRVEAEIDFPARDSLPRGVTRWCE